MSGVSPLFTKKGKQEFWWLASYLGVKVHCSWQPPCSSSSVTVVREYWPYWEPTAILAHRRLSVSKYYHWAHFTLCCMTIIITIGIAYCHLFFIVDSCSINWLRSQGMQFKLIFIDIKSSGQYRFRITIITGKTETTINTWNILTKCRKRAECWKVAEVFYIYIYCSL
jgi:hypothetical protein